MNKLLTEARKASVAIVGLAAEGVSLGLIPHPYDIVVSSVIGVLTALGVYTVPNAPARVGATVETDPGSKS